MKRDFVFHCSFFCLIAFATDAPDSRARPALSPDALIAPQSDDLAVLQVGTVCGMFSDAESYWFKLMTMAESILLSEAMQLRNGLLV